MGRFCRREGGEGGRGDRKGWREEGGRKRGREGKGKGGEGERVREGGDGNRKRGAREQRPELFRCIYCTGGKKITSTPLPTTACKK